MVARSLQDPGVIAEGVARFVPPGVDAAGLPRSFALIEALPARPAIPGSWRVIPRSERASDAFVAEIQSEPDTTLYGTGEVAGPLRRNGFVTEAWAKQPFRIESDGAASRCPTG